KNLKPLNSSSLWSCPLKPYVRTAPVVLAPAIPNIPTTRSALAIRCWASSPSRRPTASDLVMEIENLLKLARKDEAVRQEQAALSLRPVGTAAIASESPAAAAVAAAAAAAAAAFAVKDVTAMAAAAAAAGNAAETEAQPPPLTPPPPSQAEPSATAPPAQRPPGRPLAVHFSQVAIAEAQNNNPESTKYDIVDNTALGAEG
ncbi:hypothetical protein VaNZ11_003330, partial [Volvox africanus]